MQRRYKAYIDDIDFTIDLEGKELCSFITHFGKFGNIEIYDQKNNELLLNTKGVFIDSFYPDESNRENARHRGGHLSYMFENYWQQKKLKYPVGRLRSIYKDINDRMSQKKSMENPIVVCNQCLHKVYPSCVDQYNYQCFVDTKYLYEFETHTMDKVAYLDMMSIKTGCPRDQIETIHCAYDDYISKAYMHDISMDGPMTFEDFYKQYEPVQEPLCAMTLNVQRGG